MSSRSERTPQALAERPCLLSVAVLPSTANLVLLLSVLFALLPVALCYALRWALARGRLDPPWIFPMVTVLGGIGGLLFALYAHAEVASIFERLPGELPQDPLIRDAVLAPAAEELGKAFVLLPLLLTPWYRGPVDGILYGFAAGAGFACAENFMYFHQVYAFSGGEAWVWAVLSRAAPSATIHGGATAAVGAFLGAARFDGRPVVVLGAPVAGYTLALLVHGLWNAMLGASVGTGEVRWLRFALLELPFVVLCLFAAISVSLKVEAAAMARVLREEVEAGVLVTSELQVLLDPRARRGGLWCRSTGRARLVGAGLALGFALHRFRREGRGAGRVARLRVRFRRAVRREEKR